MNESPTRAFPLCWPPGWKRKKMPERARFNRNHTIYSTSRKLVEELERLGAKKIIMSTDLVLNKDGTPRSSQRQPEDQAVAVYFELDGKSQCIPLDRWDRIEHNFHAIKLCVQAIRGLERWGASVFVDAAFSGFKSIPEKTGFNFREVLELDDSSDLNDAERHYKQLALTHHPDHEGGSDEAMSKLNLAMSEAREYFKVEA